MSKPTSKFVLPRSYIRKTTSNEDYVAEDELMNEPTIMTKPEPPINVPKPLKKKGTSAYHMFIKETMASLSQTHKNLNSRERFTLTVLMWGEHKKTMTNAKN